MSNKSEDEKLEPPQPAPYDPALGPPPRPKVPGPKPVAMATSKTGTYQPTCEKDGHILGITKDGVRCCIFCGKPAKPVVSAQESADQELTDEQREIIDHLAGSISKLCHRVIAKRLEQFAVEIMKGMQS